MHIDIGVGATDEFNLRVSVATLAKVIFDHPNHGRRMLVLERTATLADTGNTRKVVVRAKPFGGGVRINDPLALQKVVGVYHFDSQRSRAELDFRVFIRPEIWLTLVEFCVQHLKLGDDVLDSSPKRELEEEFVDTMDFKVTPEQYSMKPVGIVIEDIPDRTESVRAAGSPTVRIYRVFEIRIADRLLVDAILGNNKKYLDEDLRKLAWQDLNSGGAGRANAVLAVPLDQLTTAYTAISPEERIKPIRYKGHLLDGNVPAILEGIEVSKYQRFKVMR